MVNYACAFGQSEFGKYFEWIINTVARQCNDTKHFSKSKDSCAYH